MLGSDYCYEVGYDKPVGFVEELGLNTAKTNLILGETAAKLLKI